MAWTSQGLAQAAQRAEVPIGSSSLVAHCSAFAAGKGLLMTWTSPWLVHAAQLAEVPADASSLVAHGSAFVGILA
jgi:hypothetical protein